jgi:ATP-dependent DNA ligase
MADPTSSHFRIPGPPAAVFFAFDILILAGRDVRMLPLSERRQLLRDTLRISDLVQASESFQIPPPR